MAQPKCGCIRTWSPPGALSTLVAKDYEPARSLWLLDLHLVAPAGADLSDSMRKPHHLQKSLKLQKLEISKKGPPVQESTVQCLALGHYEPGSSCLLAAEAGREPSGGSEHRSHAIEPLVPLQSAAPGWGMCRELTGVGA